MFNIQEFLEDEKIEHWTEGKNVVEGFVNVNCVFCDDPSNHLGFEIEKPYHPKCWRCGSHTLYEFLNETGFANIPEVIRRYDDEVERYHRKVKEKSSVGEVKLPPYENLSMNERRYLRKRGFRDEILERGWGIYSGGIFGEYKYRIIIPVYHEGTVISYQGRDITGKLDEKYKTCHGTNIKNVLYGMDYILGDRMIICEGVTDVWRLGAGYAVATFGINYSTAQLAQVVKKGIKHVLIFFDADKNAQKQAIKLQNDLQLFDINTWRFKWLEGDPAEMTAEQVDKVLNQLKKMK